MHDRAIDGRSAPLLSRAVEMAHIGFGMADAEGAVTYANPRLAEILGRADAVGLTLHELGLDLVPGSSQRPAGRDDATSRLAPGPDERLIDGRTAAARGH